MDRRSLLEYAAALGKASHFEDLARWLRWKVPHGCAVGKVGRGGGGGTRFLSLFEKKNHHRSFSYEKLCRRLVFAGRRGGETLNGESSTVCSLLWWQSGR